MSDKGNDLRNRAARLERRAVIVDNIDSDRARKLETRKKILLGSAALTLNDRDLLQRLVARLSERDQSLFVHEQKDDD